MRTQDEIVERLEARKVGDPLCFEVDEYLIYLDYKHAKPYLKDGTTEREWDAASDHLSLPERMRDYMSFAWNKANNERGISANRSIMHYIAWLWLAEENKLLARVESEYQGNYCSYGKPILRMICKHFGWDWSQRDK